MMLNKIMRTLGIIAFLLVFMGGALSQEGTPTETPTALVIDAPIEIPTETPTSTVTETLIATVTETASATATETPLEMATAEVTDEPISQATTTSTVEATATFVEISPTTLPLEPPLSLLFVDPFDTANDTAWVFGTGWTWNEQMLQVATSGVQAQFVNAIVYNGAAQARVRLGSGGVQLHARSNNTLAYTVTLDASGLVTLARAGTVVQMALTLPLAPDSWHTLRLSAIEGTIRVSVDEAEILTWWDDAPLPPGAVAMNAVQPTEGSTEITLAVDDFALWIPTVELSLYPTPTATPTWTPIPAIVASETEEMQSAAVPRPVQRQPGNAQFLNNSKPVLMWDAVTSTTGGVVTYQLQVASNSRFTNPIIDLPGYGVNNHTPVNALVDSRYYWRVRALENGLPGAWSPVWQFTIDTVAPPVPTLAAPLDGVIVTNPRLKFTWGPATSGVTYQLRLDTFNPPVALIPARSRTYTPPAPLLYATYFWQVQAVDAAGNESGWTSIRSVQIGSAPNAVPLLHRYTTGTPTLTWTPVQWAQGYQLQVDDNRSFSSPLSYDVANYPLNTVVASLPNGIYYWRIRPKRDATRWGGWSSTGTFQIER